MTPHTSMNNKYIFIVASFFVLGSLSTLTACAQGDHCSPAVSQKPYTTGLEFEDASAAYTIYTADRREVRASVIVQGTHLVATFTEQDSNDNITSSLDTEAAPETIAIEALASYNEASDFSYGLWVVWSAQVGESESERITKLSLLHPTENGQTLELNGWDEDRSYVVATSSSRAVMLAEIDHDASGDNLSLMMATFPYYEELPSMTPVVESRMPVEGVRVHEMHRLGYDELSNSFELVAKFEDGSFQQVTVLGYCPAPDIAGE